MSGVVQKTVFISYRRATPFHARAIYQFLTANDYDVFMDVEGMDSGAFDEILLRQIAARAHFVVLLTPGALDRCVNPDDWLRREIEHAISTKRNIVPIMFEGFSFGAVRDKLTGALRVLDRYNGLVVPSDYFDEAMDRLISRFLNVAVEAVLHPTLPADQPIVAERKAEADAHPPVTKEKLTAEQYVAQALVWGDKDPDASLTAANKAVKVAPELALAYGVRGYACYLKGDYDQAIMDLNEAIRLDAKDPFSYNVRGLVFRQLGDNKRALGDFTEAIRFDPTLVIAYRNRASTYYALDKDDLAEADDREADRLEGK